MAWLICCCYPLLREALFLLWYHYKAIALLYFSSFYFGFSLFWCLSYGTTCFWCCCGFATLVWLFLVGTYCFIFLCATLLCFVGIKEITVPAPIRIVPFLMTQRAHRLFFRRHCLLAGSYFVVAVEKSLPHGTCLLKKMDRVGRMTALVFFNGSRCSGLSCSSSVHDVPAFSNDRSRVLQRFTMFRPLRILHNLALFILLWAMATRSRNAGNNNKNKAVISAPIYQTAQTKAPLKKAPLKKAPLD